MSAGLAFGRRVIRPSRLDQHASCHVGVLEIWLRAFDTWLFAQPYAPSSCNARRHMWC
jgi:hypothetical protein